MVELWTEDPRLVALYDVECAGRWDHDVYLDLAAELSAGTVVDLGCGTGVFVADLVDRGHRAIGIDPAGPMLDLARRRLDHPAATWIRGDASAGPTGVADLVVMMGHVSQYFLDDDHWATTLADIRRMLVPGGRLAFETRNPAIDWAGEWTRERTASVHPHPDGGQFTSWVEVVDVTGTPPASFTETHQGHTLLPDGSHLVSTETLRFRTPAEIDGSLHDAGFSIVATWGDWQREPFDPATSRELLVLARAG